METTRLNAPAREVASEYRDKDLAKFKEKLKEKSPNEEHLTQISRSVVKFPPSNNAATLRLF